MKYYCDNLVEVWKRDWFEANDNDKAIELAKSGEYEPLDSEFLEEYMEYVRDNNDVDFVFELYDENDNLITRHER